MVELEYPSPDFLKKAMGIIKNGDTVAINVLTVKRKNNLLRLLPELVETKVVQSKKLGWKYVIYILLSLKFSAVFFFAKSGGYKTSFVEIDECLLITMKPAK